jgi:hypothetical protein
VIVHTRLCKAPFRKWWSRWRLPTAFLLLTILLAATAACSPGQDPAHPNTARAARAGTCCLIAIPPGKVIRCLI